VQNLTDVLLEKIKNHPYGRSVRNLTIIHKGDSVILQGESSSFYCKQVIQEIIRRDLNDKKLFLHNRIEVLSDEKSEKSEFSE